jgi:uncharacterized membrane protein
MTAAQLTVVGAGLFFVLIFLSGLWLSRHKRPFNSVVLTIHKLIALAAAVLLVVRTYQANQVAALTMTGLVAGVVTGLLFLGTGIAGGLLSTDKPMPPAVWWTHRVTLLPRGSRCRVCADRHRRPQQAR